MFLSKWKVKLFIQKLIAVLPENLSYKVYFQVQKKFGRIKNYNPMNPPSGGISEGVAFLRKIKNIGYPVLDKIFFEVGTGWVGLVPLTYWLAGAGKIITVDINPWLNKELIQESLLYISTHNKEIEAVMGDLLVKERLVELIEFYKTNKFDLKKYLELCRIRYICPGDAAETNLEDGSIDYHTSSAVLEHIPMNILKKVFLEGNRIVKRDGLFIHDIDYSDHYAAIDKSISSINFLRYSENEHKRFIHRFHYVNRLRHDDFLDFFQDIGHEIVETVIRKDAKAKELLDNDEIKIDEKFETKTKEILSITGAWIITRKRTE